MKPPVDFDQLAAEYAKELGLDIHQWHWIKDRFKDPVCYQRYRHDTSS